MSHRRPHAVFDLAVVIDAQAIATERLDVADEIGRPQVSADALSGIGALLVHADGCVHPVVENDAGHLQIELRGDCELAGSHQKVAVTSERHDRHCIATDERCGDRCRYGIPHRSRDGPEIGAGLAEPVVAGEPTVKVASVAGHDRLGRQQSLQGSDHQGRIDA